MTSLADELRDAAQEFMRRVLEIAERMSGDIERETEARVRKQLLESLAGVLGAAPIVQRDTKPAKPRSSTPKPPPGDQQQTRSGLLEVRRARAQRTHVRPRGEGSRSCAEVQAVADLARHGGR